MGRHSAFDDPAPSGGMTEHLNALLRPPSPGPAPITDSTSILADSGDHVRVDLEHAPQAIATFRQVAGELRDLMDVASRLANLGPPGFDGVSINAAKEIAQWAAGGQPGSLTWSLQSGSIQLEETADALEHSLVTHQNTDEANAAQLRRSAP